MRVGKTEHITPSLMTQLILASQFHEKLKSSRVGTEQAISFAGDIFKQREKHDRRKSFILGRLIRRSQRRPQIANRLPIALPRLNHQWRRICRIS
jgi:hypothetical protein